MNIFKRLFKIGQAEANSAVDKLEDPIKMTEQGIRDLKKDLSAALQAIPLKPGPKPKFLEKSPPEEIVRKPCDIELLIPKDFWVKEFEKVNTKQASNLGKVICRRWISNHRRPLNYQKSFHFGVFSFQLQQVLD